MTLAVSAPERGDLVWLEFSPQTGHEQAGRRPALVIQNDVGNRHAPTTIVAVMTTRVAAKSFPTEVRLPDAVFGKPSTVLASQVFTLAQDRLVGAPLAALDCATMAEVDAALKRSLGL